MAGYVKSVENVTGTMVDTTSLPITLDIALTKSQDHLKCVPYITFHHSLQGTNYRVNNYVGAEMIDDAGTPTVRVHWTPRGNANTIELQIFVVEYGANVTVQSGIDQITTTTLTVTVSSFVQANSFVVYGQEARGDTGTSAHFYGRCLMQCSFPGAGPNDTQIQWERTDESNNNPDWEIYWYLVESNGTDFTTEYAEDTFALNFSGTQAITIASTTIANAHIIPTYQIVQNSDDLVNAILNMALTGPTTLTLYRDGGGSPVGNGTVGCWVVKANATEISTQRITADTSVDEINDVTITSVDLDRAIMIAGHHISPGEWPCANTTAGNRNNRFQNSYRFFNATTARSEMFLAIGDSSNVRYEAVELELESVGPPGYPPIHKHMQNIGAYQ